MCSTRGIVLIPLLIMQKLKSDMMNIEEELCDLVYNTPSKHYNIYIKNEKLGINFMVDQSLDSHIEGNPESMKQLLDMMWRARLHFKNNSYKSIFDDKEVENMKMDGFDIRFEGVKGEKAITLMLRYFNNLLKQLEEKNIIKIRNGTEMK